MSPVLPADLANTAACSPANSSPKACVYIRIVVTPTTENATN